MAAEYGPGDRLLLTLLIVAILGVILPLYFWAAAVVLLVIILVGYANSAFAQNAAPLLAAC